MTEADKTRQKSGLTQKQYNAINALLAGATDQYAAKLCGVTRQTVNGWKNNDPEFIAELNQRREALCETYIDQVRAMAGEALKLAAKDLKGSYGCDFNLNRAVQLLKAIGIYGKGAIPKPPTRVGPSPEPSSPSKPKEDIPQVEQGPLETSW